MNDIKQFLNGQFSYTRAVELYDLHGKNSALKFLFSLGETSDNRKRIISELTELSSYEIPVVKPVIKSVSPTIPSKKAKIDIGSLPPYLRQKNVDKGILYQEMSHLHLQMVNAKTDKKRAELRAQIIEKDEQIAYIWKELDYYQENKTMLERPEEKVVTQPDQSDPLALYKQLTNVRAHISKLKKNPDKSELLKQKIAEKDELEMKLAAVR